MLSPSTSEYPFRSFTNGSVIPRVKINMVRFAAVDGDDANIGLFVDARHKLLEWRRATRIALQIVDLHFPKSHPFRKSVQNLCGGNCEFRYQAEIAACRTADKFGDDLFRITIDGVYMRTGPTDLFYGDTLQKAECNDGVPCLKVSGKACQDKTLNIREISHLYSLISYVQSFMDAVKLLPTGARINSAAHRALEENEKRRKKACDAMVVKLRSVVIDHSQTIQVLCLSRVGVSGDIGKAIVDYLV